MKEAEQKKKQEEQQKIIDNVEDEWKKMSEKEKENQDLLDKQNKDLKEKLASLQSEIEQNKNRITQNEQQIQTNQHTMAQNAEQIEEFEKEEESRKSRNDLKFFGVEFDGNDACDVPAKIEMYKSEVLDMLLQNSSVEDYGGELLVKDYRKKTPALKGAGEIKSIGFKDKFVGLLDESDWDLSVLDNGDGQVHSQYGKFKTFLETFLHGIFSEYAHDLKYTPSDHDAVEQQKYSMQAIIRENRKRMSGEYDKNSQKKQELKETNKELLAKNDKLEEERSELNATMEEQKTMEEDLSAENSRIKESGKKASESAESQDEDLANQASSALNITAKRGKRYAWAKYMIT